jgi:hypothetical protein
MSNRDDSNFFSEEEYDENFNGNEDEEGDEASFIHKNEALYTMELDHLDDKLNKKTNLVVLKEAIKLAKGTWFWRLRSHNKKVGLILSFYYDLVEHVNFVPNELE